MLNYVEFASVVLEKKIFKNAPLFFYSFKVFSALNIDRTFISAIYIRPPIRMLCAKFGLNWISGYREEVQNVKSLQTDGRTDRRTDGRRTKGDQKSSLELSAQVS